jgi:acetate kinase
MARASCALRNGQSIATTIGFTALGGLPIGRCCGNLDPDVVSYLIRDTGLLADAVQDLYRESGLYGVSGISDDMRDLSHNTYMEAKCVGTHPPSEIPPQRLDWQAVVCFEFSAR